ncbi:MAG: hypothetical protein ABEJ58_09380 [Halodesulfurarchaeum sp.]
MQERTVEQVETWESRPFSGGFSALHDLAEDSFTGSVVADETWVFMLNGRVVGVFEGSIDDLEDATGTIYDAPHDSLPLLFSMQERGGETRAKYFTNDTPLEEADSTLSSANFTGYIVLSENVLSGDYYIVYYGGKKLSAAFIGQSERLLTGDEAYDRASGEVGIYEVKDVSITITEIPEPPEPPEPEREDTNRDESTQAAPGYAPTGSEEDVETASTDARSEDVDATGPESASDESVEDETVGGGSDSVPEVDETIEAADENASEIGTDISESEAESQQSAETGGEPTTSGAEYPSYPGLDDESPIEAAEPDDTGREPGDTSPPEVEDSSDTVDGSPSGDSAEREDAGPGPEPADSEDIDDTDRDADEQQSGPERSVPREFPTDSSDDTGTVGEEEKRPMFREEEAWRKTRSIPALDPDQTVDTQEDDSASEPEPSGAENHGSTGETSRARDRKPGVPRERIEELQSALEERAARIEELRNKLEQAKSERAEVTDQLETLREERNDLQERVSNLESALQRANQRDGVNSMATELTPEEALADTNLFVRYESKGKATLSALTGSQVDPDSINDNLRLEHHTQFEEAEVSVEGKPFDEFLESSSGFRFVTWLVRTLPYELLESGGQSGLQALYEVIPKIDRAEFYGTVSGKMSGGQSATEEFAVVVRDRMGNPLIVAELNDERDPVRGEEMSGLIDAANAIASAEESLSGAFYVTASFFEPDALEAAEAAASSGGLFSRSNRKSFVKAAGKDGYHLLLVEDRGQAYHVTVPEL